MSEDLNVGAEQEVVVEPAVETPVEEVVTPETEVKEE
jgi:hypothetical protein